MQIPLPSIQKEWGARPLFSGDLRHFGYVCLGPLLVGFCNWLHEQAAQVAADPSLLFTTRDCELFYKTYVRLFPEAAGKSRYVLSSRTASRAEPASPHSQAYATYLSAKLGARDPVVVDIGYVGSAQRCFASLLGRPVGGLYLLTHVGVKTVGACAGPVRAYLASDLKPHDDGHVANRNRYFLEAILCGTGGRFLHFSAPDQPVFASVVDDQRSLAIRQQVHEGALAFVGDYCSGPRQAEARKYCPEGIELLWKFLQHPHPEDAALFQGLLFEDVMAGRARTFVVAPDADRADSYALWIAGQDALDRRRSPGRRPFHTLERSVLRQWFGNARFARFATNRRRFMAESRNRWWRIYGRLTTAASPKYE